jgi:hypothetical protein
VDLLSSGLGSDLLIVNGVASYLLMRRFTVTKRVYFDESRRRHFIRLQNVASRLERITIETLWLFVFFLSSAFGRTPLLSFRISDDWRGQLEDLLAFLVFVVLLASRGPSSSLSSPGYI